MTEALRIATDVCVLLGCVGLNVCVLGVVRRRPSLVKIHAAATGLTAGVVLVLLGAAFTGDAAILLRAVLVGVLVCITTPAGAHVMTRLVRSRELRDSPSGRSSGAPGSDAVVD